MKFTRDHLTTITAASAELQQLAIDIRESTSIAGRGVQWDSLSDERSHDRLQRLAKRLHASREKLAA